MTIAGNIPRPLRRNRERKTTGQPFDMTFPLRGADGRFRLFLTRVQPLLDDQGRVAQPPCWLPVAASGKASPEESPAESGTNHKARILVVDDNPDAAQSLAKTPASTFTSPNPWI